MSRGWTVFPETRLKLDVSYRVHRRDGGPVAPPLVTCLDDHPAYACSISKDDVEQQRASADPLLLYQ